jgi:uncharacterized protein YndB with AHSA1/START domain
MTDQPSNPITIERTYTAAPERIWQLWTTADGIPSWWAPDGFSVTVQRLDLRPGGELVYTMTATAAEQIEFMKSVGMPLETVSRKTFTEVTPNKRLAYQSLADFIPDAEPYEFLTVVDLEPTDGGTKVTMSMEPMHDDVWTQRLTMGRENELNNLGAIVGTTAD